MEYTFPNKLAVLPYLESHLKCPPDLALKIYDCIGGHMGEVGKLLAEFEGSEPTQSEIVGDNLVLV